MTPWNLRNFKPVRGAKLWRCSPHLILGPFRKPKLQEENPWYKSNCKNCSQIRWDVPIFLSFSCVLLYTTSNKKRLLYSHGKPIVPTQLLRALRTQVRWGFPTEASAPAAVPPNQLLDAGWPKRSENFWPNQRWRKTVSLEMAVADDSHDSSYRIPWDFRCICRSMNGWVLW